MKGFPRALTKLPATFIHMGTLPSYFLAATLLFEPRALMKLMEAGGMQTFNIVICSAILLVTMALMRITLWLMRKHFPSDLWRYSFWCVAEILISCAFTGLYLVLMDQAAHGGYFHYFGASISSIGTMMIAPYLVLTLLYMALDDSGSAQLNSDARLKFYDNRHQLKFITTASSITYIESNENYILVHYLENGLAKKYQIRNSMKSIEPLCEQAGFARAHRCYIINPLHIKQIRKTPNGMTFADIGDGSEQGIPVSKKYYGSIASML